MSELLRTSRYLTVVPRKSDSALYHGLYGNLCVADAQTLQKLREFTEPRSVAAAPQSFIDFFRSKRLLVPSDLDETSFVHKRRLDRERALASATLIRAVQLVLTNRCNFRCTYCFEGLGETPIEQTVYAHSSRARTNAQRSPANATMTPERAEAYLGAAIDLVRRAGNADLAVQFFGGEPLVNWRTLRHVLTTFGNACNGVALTYSVVTNGSIITDEMARLFREHEVPIIVSYDSPKGEPRPMRSGRSSHDAVRRGIDLLKRYGNRIAINAALTCATFDLFVRELVDFAIDHGVYEIGAVLDLDPQFYVTAGASEIVDRLWDVCTYGASRGVIVTGYWHQIFQGIASDDRYAAIGYKNCSAMGAQLSIEPSGRVFACKASGGYLGHILQWPELLQSEAYRTYAMRACTSPAACRGCEIEHFCGGLCLGAVENKYGGDIYAVEASACEVYRDLTHRFIQTAA
jgi:uncharacterized protein